MQPILRIITLASALAVAACGSGEEEEEAVSSHTGRITLKPFTSPTRQFVFNAAREDCVIRAHDTECGGARSAAIFGTGREEGAADSIIVELFWCEDYQHHEEGEEGPFGYVEFQDGLFAFQAEHWVDLSRQGVVEIEGSKLRFVAPFGDELGDTGGGLMEFEADCGKGSEAL